MTALDRVNVASCVLLFSAFLVAGCANESDAFEGVEFDVAEVLSPVDTLQFEADDAYPIVSVKSIVHWDSGYVITGAVQAHVQLYNYDGSFRGAFGREGDGPGEFRLITDADVTPEGQLVLADAKRRVISVVSAGGTLDYEIPIHGTRVEKVRAIGEGRYLVAAYEGVPGYSVYYTDSTGVPRSGASRVKGTAKGYRRAANEQYIALVGNTLVNINRASDTLTITQSGHAELRVAFRAPDYSVRKWPSPGSLKTGKQMREWQSSQTWIAGLFPMDDHIFGVSYYGPEDTSGRIWFRLMFFDVQGHPLFATRRSSVPVHGIFQGRIYSALVRDDGGAMFIRYRFDYPKDVARANYNAPHGSPSSASPRDQTP